MRLLLIALTLFFPTVVQAEQLFAEIDGNSIVLRVIVAGPEFIAKMPGTWVETEYNGKIRKNYAGIGHRYDAAKDGFISPKPEIDPDATLDEATLRWKFSPAIEVVKKATEESKWRRTNSNTQ